MTGPGLLVDSHGRTLRDLRISVTDRCNFRCLYCLPETEAAANFYRDRWATQLHSTPIVRQWQPKDRILTYEEIIRVARIFAARGINKLRLTGGEPLLRAELEHLVAGLAGIPGIKDIALTTNGFLFPARGRALRAAGLHRVSFSCDSLNPARFQKMTGRDGLASVHASIQLARELGFNPIKVNAVVIRGINDDEIETLAEWAARDRLHLRFIEFMPLDSGRAWQKEMVLPGREILRRLRERFDLRPVAATNPAETARRWRFADTDAEIGIIAPVSEPFCGHCNRIRMTADGQIRTCLFSVREHDLRTLMHAGADDAAIDAWLEEVVTHKEAGHRIGQPGFEPASRSMSCIGG